MRNSALALIILCGLLCGGCQNKKRAAYSGPPRNDVEFAKEVFRLLAEGDEAVTDMIDWEHLNVPGVFDVGEKYRELNDEAARNGFRTSFIRSYSGAFKSKGGISENLLNWREQSRDPSNTIVVANNPVGKQLLITVAHVNGQQKVSQFELR